MLTDSALILISDAVSIMGALYKSINEQPDPEKLVKYVQENAGESVYLVNDADMEKIIMVKDMANMFCNLTGVTPQDITLNGNSFCSVMGDISDRIDGATRGLPRVPLSAISGSVTE